jgi:hypothetical protein
LPQIAECSDSIWNSYNHVFTKVSDKVYDVSYVLGQEGTKRLEGTESAIDFGKDIGESQTTSFTTSSMTNGKFSFGQILFNREL